MPVVHDQDPAVVIARLIVDDGLRHLVRCTSKAWGYYDACTNAHGHLSMLYMRELQVVLVGPPTCLFCVAR